MKKRFLILIIIMAVSTTYIIGQEDGSIDQVVYLIGNTTAGEINKENLA